jgi:DNA repair exonuclease SbcCD ATPase subunit
MSYKNPFIKVEWEDTPENLTQERIKRVKEYFKKKYNATDVKIVTKALSNDSTTKLRSLEVSDSILDPMYQKNLVKEFITENKIDIKWEMIDRLDNRVNGEIDKTEENKVRFNKWYIKKIEFSNFLSFGDDNVIDFTELDGITTVESTPKNFGGKTTSTVDLMMFLFFNSTTKGKIALDVFNIFRDCNEVKVKGYITIDDDDYIIERKIIRKKSKGGEYSAKSELEFYKMVDNNPVNLAGEQRRETEKFITAAIGTEEDFLATILTTGHNLEDLIDSKPTARGQVLTRFLGLEALKKKEEICKDIYNEWSKKLVSNTYNKVQLETDNDAHTVDIFNSEREIIKLGKDLKGFEENLKTLETKKDELMQSKNNDIDIELIRTNPIQLKREIDEDKTKQANTKAIGASITVAEPAIYYNEEDHAKNTAEINEVLADDRVNNSEIIRNEKLVKDLETGLICPTCKRPLEGVDHTNEINETKSTVIRLNKIKLANEETLKNLRESESLYVGAKKVYEEYERNKLRKEKNELEVAQMQLSIDKSQARLDNYDKNKSKLEQNQKIDGEIVILRTKIETCNADIRITNTNIEKHKTNIITLNEKIKINLDLIKKIKSEEELIAVFKTYLMIYGKNGISKVIMKNMIPLLNQELHRVLVDTCKFSLELIINEKNEVEFLMIDHETRIAKSLNSGSGYEKTVASLALRSVLTKVSSLPKPNIVVMDEIFKGVADENLELIGEFFKKIKNYFEHIFVISHNPLIRNWSDNLIMITKDDNVSSIESITTKITA